MHVFDPYRDLAEVRHILDMGHQVLARVVEAEAIDDRFGAQHVCLDSGLLGDRVLQQAVDEVDVPAHQFFTLSHLLQGEGAVM